MVFGIWSANNPDACSIRRASSVSSRGDMLGQLVSVKPSTLRKSIKLVTGTPLFKGLNTLPDIREGDDTSAGCGGFVGH